MNRKLRIGILLDSFDVTAWEFCMVEKIVHSTYAKVDLIVLNATSSIYKSRYEKLKENRNKIMYLIYTKVDKKIFRTEPDAFAKRNLKALLSHVPILEVSPIQKRFSDYFESKDITEIKKYNLDILIRMGFRVLKGDILTISKYGIWSYHHGDNTINRGGPAGFWEVVEGWPETGSILQILNEDLDNGTVIYRSWSRTHQPSPAKNRNKYYWKTLSFLPRKLKELHAVGEEKFFLKTDKFNKRIDFYSHRLYRTPSNLKALQLASKQLFKILSSVLQRMFFFGQWFLMFNLDDDLSTSFRKFKKIMPPKDRFWADPHIIVMNKKFYIFIEEFMYTTMKGHISVIEMERNGNFSEPRKVLEKNYHLSYPFIFEWEGNLYMLPESSQNKTIELYECIEFPHKWVHKMDFMKGLVAFDSTLLYHDKKWWLFTNIVENEGAPIDDELFLFYSEELLTTNWKHHPLNPIVSDVKEARSAGRIFKKNDRLYRPSQDCSKIYGYAFNLQEIVILTETDYDEKTISSVKPSWEKKIEGIHTFSYEEGLTMIDAFMRKRKIL